MARQATILSFDEAKRDGAARRSRSGAPARPVRSLSDFPTGEPASSRWSSLGRLDDVPLSAPRSSEYRYADSYYSARPRASYAPSSTHDFEAAENRSRRSTSSRSARSAAPRSPHAVEASADDAAADGSFADEAPAAKRASRFQKLKRSRAKSKAERAFAKQFGDDDQRSDGESAQPASRAAVYEARMGSKHRQAARMQNGRSSGRGSSSKGFALPSIEALASSRVFVASAVAACCLLLSCWFLYPAAQQCYQSVRENDRLQAEYAALSERNEALAADVELLQTDAGIEQRAHDQMGWVKQGEETATVSGLNLQEADEEDLRANISSDSVEAPETWYSPVLDVLFGVE